MVVLYVLLAHILRIDLKFCCRDDFWGGKHESRHPFVPFFLRPHGHILPHQGLMLAKYQAVASRLQEV